MARRRAAAVGADRRGSGDDGAQHADPPGERARVRSRHSIGDSGISRAASPASDQASHEMARGLILLAPCSGVWFPRSRHYSTALLSPKRYGKRYEDEMPVVKFELIGPEATMRANHLPGRACRPV